MKFKYIFFALIINFSCFFAQQKTSYFNEILEKKEKEAIILIEQNPKLGLEKTYQLLELSKKDNNPYYEVIALELIDAYYFNTNEYKHLLKSTENTIKKARETHYFIREMEALFRKADALMHLGLMDEAKKILDSIQPALVKINPKDDEELQIIAAYWHTYSEYYNIQTKDQQAREKLMKALSLIQKIKDNQVRNKKLIQVYTMIGSSYLFQSKTDSSAYYFKTAEKLFPIAVNHDKRNDAIVYSGLGMGYNKEGQYEKAIPFLMKGLSISKTNKYTDVYVITLEELSTSFSKIKGKENPYLEKYIYEKEDFDKKNKLSAEEADQIKEKELSFLNRNKKILVPVTSFLVVFLVAIVFFQIKKRKKAEQKSKIISSIVEKRNQEISELKFKINDAFEEVLILAKHNNPSFLKRFSEVYEVFYEKITKNFPHLSETQLKIIALTYLNFSTKDIADITNTSARTISTHKYNIRKILNIPTKEDFTKWIKNFESS